MTRREATIEEFFTLLPELEELEVLRLRLVAGAVPDARRQWDSSSDYSTIDRRIVTADSAERVLKESEDALHQQVTALHDDLRRVVRSFWSGEVEECVRSLLEMGSRIEQGGRTQKALQSYRIALSLALPLARKEPQIQALRRIARLMLSVGEFHEALSHYARSTELAADTGDLRGEVIGRTGTGNVRVWQGQWAEAERCYLEALQLARSAPDPSGLILEMGQLYNNFGNLLVRQGRLEEAEVWLDRASETWDAISSPPETAISLSTRAQLREGQGRQAEALALYEQALAMPVTPALRAIIATDLANALLKEGKMADAVRVGREAEEHAIAARSPYTLGYMYQGRGRLASARGEEDGFIFFEKALQIARETGYPFLEAETLLDYARLRLQSGGRDEARAYLEHARETFIQLGAVRLQADAEELLAGIDKTPPQAVAAD